MDRAQAVEIFLRQVSTPRKEQVGTRPLGGDRREVIGGEEKLEPL